MSIVLWWSSFSYFFLTHKLKPAETGSKRLNRPMGNVEGGIDYHLISFSNGLLLPEKKKTEKNDILYSGDI